MGDLRDGGQWMGNCGWRYYFAATTGGWRYHFAATTGVMTCTTATRCPHHHRYERRAQPLTDRPDTVHSNRTYLVQQTSIAGATKSVRLQQDNGLPSTQPVIPQAIREPTNQSVRMGIPGRIGLGMIMLGAPLSQPAHVSMRLLLLALHEASTTTYQRVKH